MTAEARHGQCGRPPWPAWGVVGLVVIASTVLPRLATIGVVPGMDEGIYAFNAQWIHHGLASGGALPDTGTMMLYPLLVSWVFHCLANPFILLRLCDLTVAAIAAGLLCVILQRESRDRSVGAGIAFIFLWAMNQPGFVDSGFKNPIFAAYLPLFSAFALIQFLPEQPSRWYLAGALTALAVLLREPFIAVAVAASIMALRARRRHGLCFILGGTAVGAGGIAALCLARGSIGGLVDGYLVAAKVYRSFAKIDGMIFFKSAAWMIYYAIPAVIVGVAGAVLAFRAAAPGGAGSRGRLYFWLVVTVTPLWEPIAKFALPYHFAQCLPGLAGLTAFGWCHADEAARARILSPRAVVGGAIALIVVLNTSALVQQWPSSMRALLAMRSGSWPTQTVEHSDMLRAAAAIRKIAPVDATLSIADFQIELYPLTGLLPPNYRLESLRIAAIDLEQSEPRLQALLTSCPPDIVFVTIANLPKPQIISAAVLASGLYREVAEVPFVTAAGHKFSGTIYGRDATRPVNCAGE